MRRERFSGLRIRQFFVCHQPQSIQVLNALFLCITNCTPVCVLHSHLRKTGQRTHALRISLFTSCRVSFTSPGGVFNDSGVLSRIAVKSGRPAKPESTGCYRLAAPAFKHQFTTWRRVIRLTWKVQLSSSAPPRFARLVSCPAITALKWVMSHHTPVFAVDGA